VASRTMRLLLCALLGVALAVEYNPEDQLEEEKDSAGIFKEVNITMVSQVLDGTSFTIKDQSNKPLTLHVGAMVPGDPEASTEKLQALLQRAMILYRPFPDDLQPGDGKVHADVWTSEGLHIGKELVKNGAKPSGVSTDYTKDILQVAAEEEKQKSYKELEKALGEQAKFEQAAAKELQAEEELIAAKKKDWLLILGAVLVVAMFIVPVVMKKRQGTDAERKAKMAAARAKAAKTAASKAD